jgi:hypothetical protein
MPITMERLKEVGDARSRISWPTIPSDEYAPRLNISLQIQDECLADDVEIPPEALAWVECEARAYFESGGLELPTIGGGFDGAEIRSFYELNQKHVESVGTDEMLGALSSALFKTTGDSKFKPEEKPNEGEEGAVDYAHRERKKYEPQHKYKVPQIGEFGSSSHVDDDTNA